MKGAVCVGVTAVFGGGFGVDGDSLVNVALLRESLRKTLAPRASNLSGFELVGLENRLATVALALRACVATGISFSGTSSSNTGAVPNLRWKGNVAAVEVLGD